MTATACLLCDEPIDARDEHVWQATSCFTACKRTRSSGRQRDMSDRIVYRYLERYAHDRCVQAFKAGRLRQESLEVLQ